MAIIEPNTINADKVTRRATSRPEGTVYALPKGGVDEGETPEQAATLGQYRTILFKMVVPKMELNQKRIDL